MAVIFISASRSIDRSNIWDCNRITEKMNLLGYCAENSWHSPWCHAMKWSVLSIAFEPTRIDSLTIQWQVYYHILKRTGWTTSSCGMCPRAIREQTTFVKVKIERSRLSMLSLRKGYHNRMNNRIYRNHPNIWSFLKFLQNEEKRVQWVTVQWLAGATKKKNLRTTNLQNRINTLNNRYANNLINASDLLLGFSYMVATKSKWEQTNFTVTAAIDWTDLHIIEEFFSA